MPKDNFYQKGYGGVEMFLCAAIIGVVIYFYFYPLKFPKQDMKDTDSGPQYCREFLDQKDAPTFTNPPVIAEDGTEIAPARKYRMIKKDVPMKFMPDYMTLVYQIYSHWDLAYNKKYEDPNTGKKYLMRSPKGITGRSYEFRSSLDEGKPVDLEFAKYGLLFLYHANDDWTPHEVTDFPPYKFNIADIYKAEGTPDFPEWVLKCLDDPPGVGGVTEEGDPIVSAPTITYELYYPDPEKNWSPTKNEEQLGWFLPRLIKYVSPAWWTPHCKPAIYLYPQEKTKVNVQVAIPQGEFLYTDPVYPSSGWNVLAEPDGKLTYLGSNPADSKGVINYQNGIFPYLYYEGKLADIAIEKPTKGYVKKFAELGSFYEDLLPKLGLNAKESKEFQEYWSKALPKSPYYFIGVVSKKNLDEIEPLTIIPKQNTTIRVSLYFEALKKFKVVTPSEIVTPKRNGFTVVEWGGMVKRDKNHPFTCVQ